MAMIMKLYFKKGFKYQTSRPFSCSTGILPEKAVETDLIFLSLSGFLIIKANYAWDGPSGPMLDTDDMYIPSLIHDALYQLMRMGLLSLDHRKDIDRLFKKLIVVNAKKGWKWFSKIRAIYAFRGLQIAKGEAAKPKNKKKEYSVTAGHLIL